jgi:hypothetical protein
LEGQLQLVLALLQLHHLLCSLLCASSGYPAAAAAAAALCVHWHMRAQQPPQHQHPCYLWLQLQLHLLLLLPAVLLCILLLPAVLPPCLAAVLRGTSPQCQAAAQSWPAAALAGKV